MKALNRKLLRDLRLMWSQALTIALVVASGIGGFITSLSAVESLAQARDDFYADAHFADLFAGVKRAPDALSMQLAAQPGVAEVQTRIEQVVRVELRDARMRLMETRDSQHTQEVVDALAVAVGAHPAGAAGMKRAGDVLPDMLRERVVVGVNAFTESEPSPLADIAQRAGSRNNAARPPRRTATARTIRWSRRSTETLTREAPASRAFLMRFCSRRESAGCGRERLEWIACGAIDMVPEET